MRKRETKWQKKTEPAKGVKKQAEKIKFIALEMEEMEERREIEGVVLKADWWVEEIAVKQTLDIGKCCTPITYEWEKI